MSLIYLIFGFIYLFRIKKKKIINNKHNKIIKIHYIVCVGKNIRKMKICQVNRINLACDFCESWYHYSCIGFIGSEI